VSPAALERYLHESIPLSVAMGVSVRAASPSRVALAAPLLPNLNPHSTVFGGSAIAVAILAAWALLQLREQTSGGTAQLVISRSEMSYERPISGPFEALCELVDEIPYQRFRTTLQRRGRARITLPAVLRQDGTRVASFEGDFVALTPGR
jgi:thioesterase domain-containing protein